MYNLLSLAATPHEGQSLAMLTARALSAEHKPIDKLRFPLRAVGEPHSKPVQRAAYQ